MLDMQDIGYILYMQEQEKKKQQEVNVKVKCDAVGGRTTADAEPKEE